MGKRLVFKIEDGQVDFGVITSFVNTAKKYGVKNDVVCSVNASEEGEIVTISIDVPKDITIVSGEAVKIKPQSRRQEKVDKQIEQHNERKDKGEKEAYVPPVGRKTASPVRKVKCPVCNVRKPIITVAGVKSLKPHTSKGEICTGSGMQVIKKGNAWLVKEEGAKV